MKVIRKRPGENPEIINVENTLEALQREIGGHIEHVGIASDLGILCDEEGILKGLPENCGIANATFRGTILAVGEDGERFCSVKDIRTVLRVLFRTTMYKCVDQHNNVWQCDMCEHLERFEADGPFENEWNRCPCCGFYLVKPL